MATPEYDRLNCRRINLKLNNKTDADIISILESQENIQGYIKTLIRTANKQPAKEYPPTRYNQKLYGCGVCGKELTGRPHYCGNCGQAIKWVK